MDRSRLGRTAPAGRRGLSHRSYRVHPDARRDLKGIIARLVIDRSSETATAFVEAARQTFIGIGESPALGSPVESHNLRLSGLRKRAISGFAHALVFYRFSEGRVTILRVLFARQDWWALLDVG